MSVHPMMTPAQMRQIIRRVDGSVPTNLSHEEANFAIDDRAVTVFGFTYETNLNKNKRYLPLTLTAKFWKSFINFASNWLTTIKEKLTTSSRISTCCLQA